MSPTPVRSQTSSQTGLPVIFVHGICDSADSFLPLEQSVKSSVMQNGQGLYGSSNEWVVFYDGSNVWFQIPKTELSAGSADPPISPQKLKSIDPSARFFLVALDDPPQSDYRNFDPNLVADVPIASKGNELAHIIWAIKSITGTPRVILVTHSMGGLDSREYIENLADATFDNDIATLVTLDAPHGGAALAGLPSLPYTDWALCFANDSPDKEEMNPSSQVMQILNYQSGNASPLPPGVTITSIASYWTIPASGALTVWGTDDVLSSDEQDLKRNLDPNANAKSVLASVDNPFYSPFLTPASGLLECGVDDFLHLLPCVGDASQTNTNVENAVQPFIIMHGGQIQILPTAQSVSPGSSISLSAQISSGGPAIWSILEGAYGGTITQAGVYTAPPNNTGASETFHIIAIDSQNPSQYGEIPVQVAASTEKATTTTVLSTTSPQVVEGMSVPLTATVQSGGGTPTGTITFYDGTNAISSPTAINGGGVATYTANSLGLGFHSISARYSGDAFDLGSASSPITITVTAEDPQLTVLPSSGTAGVTQFSQFDSGFAPYAEIKHTTTLPGGTQSVRDTYADSSGTSSSSLSYATPGSYSEIDTDVASGNETNTASWTVSSVAANDFSLSVTPSSQSLNQSGSVGFNVVTNTTSGTAQSINLSASNVPSGITASFSPTAVTSGAQSNLTVNAISSAPTGTYTITVIGTGASVTHTYQISITVVQAAAGPAVTLSPSILRFNDQPVGSVSSSNTVLLMNSGSGQLIINEIALAAGSDYMLSVPSGAFPLILNSLVPYDIQVSFAPSTTGTRPGQIIVYDNAPGSPHTVTLTGNGTPAQPTTGTINVNATLNGQAITDPQYYFQYSLSGPSSSTGYGAYSFSVSPGSYSISFSGSPKYLTLSSVSPSSTQSVAAGGTVTYTLNFTSPNDFETPWFGLPSGNPTQQLVLAGGTVTYDAEDTYPAGSAPSPLAYAVAGIPSGTTVDFNPEPSIGPSKLTIGTSANSTPAGVYTVTLSATNASGLTKVGATSALAVTVPPTIPIQPITVSTQGGDPNAAIGWAFPNSLSADGRFAVFLSGATNLISSGATGIFVRDRVQNTTQLASVSNGGVAADGFFGQDAISSDGRYVVFASSADNLGLGSNGPTNRSAYVRDLVEQKTERQDVANDGTPGDGDSWIVSISADGRFVAFISNADNLVPGVSGTQVYRRDRSTGQIILVSQAPDGSPADSSASSLAMSADGRYVAFDSTATNLVSRSTGGTRQTYVRDLISGTTTLVSVSNSGQPANGRGVDDSGDGTFGPIVMSADGRYIVFSSGATNLVTQTLDGSQDHVFVRDTQSGQTSLVDEDSVGVPIAGLGVLTAGYPSISEDGRYIAFYCLGQIVIRDMVGQKIQVVSVDENGSVPASDTSSPQTSIQPSGAGVAFTANANSFISGDSNTANDMFLAANPFLGSVYLQSILLESPNTAGGSTVSGTVTLNGAAPSGGASVAIWADNSAAQPPSIVVVPEGSNSATFNIPTSSVQRETVMAITASYNGGSNVAVLTLEPAPVLAVDPSSFDFGYQVVDTASSPEPITITNSGTATLTLNSVQLATGTSFSLSQNTCGSSVASGSSCSVSVAFKPTASGPASDALQISYGSPASVQPINLTGTGSVPSATLNPSALAFGRVAVFATATGSATLFNTGSATLSGVSATISGQNAGDFSLASDGCTGVLLPPNTSCSVTVSFTPKGTGQRQASLIVAESATGSPQTIALSGSATAITPTVAVTPSVSSVPTDQPFSVTISVHGNSNGVTPTGSVTVTSGSYVSAATALNGGTTTINVPAGQLAVGTDVLTASYTGDSNYSSATGTGSVTATAPPSLLTPTVGVSAANNGSFDSSQSEAVTVTVSGTGAAPTGSVTLSGGGYTSSATALRSGSALITIPANTFDASGSVTLTANYSGDSVYATGSGTASVTVNPPYKLTTSTPSSVNPGSPATATITLTADPSYSGSVALACALATHPSGASDLPNCSVTSGSPVTITNGVASGTATVTINTTAATSSSLDRHSLPGWLGGGGGTILALLIFFGIPTRLRNGRNLLGLLIVTATLGSFSACGGGGSGVGTGGGGGSVNPGTSAGTYTFTVTGTGTPAISPAPAVTVTLTVN